MRATPILIALCCSAVPLAASAQEQAAPVLAPIPLPDLPPLPAAPPSTAAAPWLHKGRMQAEPASPAAKRDAPATKRVAPLPVPAATAKKNKKKKSEATPAAPAQAATPALAPEAAPEATANAPSAAPSSSGAAAPLIASPPPASEAPRAATPPAELPPAAGPVEAAALTASAPSSSTRDPGVASIAPAAIVRIPFAAATAPDAASALPLPPLRLQLQYAVAAVRGAALDDAAADELEAGLRGIGAIAPRSQQPAVLPRAAQPCAAEDDACFAGRAALEGADLALVASAAREGATVALRVRVIDVVEKRRTAETLQAGLRDEAALLRASAEAQACLLLVPASCTGELHVEADAAAGPTTLVADGSAAFTVAAGAARPALTLGVHTLRAAQQGRAGPERLVAVLRASHGTLHVRPSPSGPVLLTDAELAAAAAPPAAPAAALVGTAAPATEHRAFRLPATLLLGGAGLVALAAASVQGLRSKSMLSDAESAWHAHGNTYLPSDLANLASGNSAARSANFFFVAGALLAAGGAGVFLAF